MGQIGLSYENIMRMLEEKGIHSGNQMSARKLREAIAEVVSENNREIEKSINTAVNSQLSKLLFGEIKKNGGVK